jgi:hypothetical protein
MAVTAAAIRVKFAADTSDVEQKTKELNDKVKDTGGFFSHAASTMLGFVGGALAINGAGDAFNFLKDTLVDVVNKGEAFQNTQAQINAALSSTHDVSGMSAQSINDLAESLSKTTTFSAETTAQAETMLLSFTNIGKKVFPDATKAAQDLSTRLGIDLNSAATIVGRALDNPTNAARALREAHINLTAAQQEAIKHFTAVGDKAGAQKVILDALKDRYGGAAQAAGGTLGGQLQILHNQLDVTEEKVGAALLPTLNNLMQTVTPLAVAIGTKLADGMQTVGDWISKHEPQAKVLGVTLGVLGGIIGVVLVASFVSWAIAAGSAAVATLAATWPILAVIAGIGLLVVGIKLLIDHWGQITATFNHFKDHVAGGIVSAFNGITGAVGAVFEGIWTIIKDYLNIYIGAIDFFIRAINAIKIHVPAVNIGPIHTPAGDIGFPHIPEIPYLAEGGTIAQAGLAIVGERGPELVSLPSGAQVFPNQQSQLAGQQTIIIELDGKQIARTVLRNTPELVRLATGNRAV